MKKNKLSVNILVDLAMLVATALVSISGFILEVVIPSRHAVRMHGADSWCSHLCGLGRHGWGDVHLWTGIALLVLLAAHILLHLNIVSAFFKKRCPNRTLRMALYAFLLMLLLITIVPWFYMYY